MSFLLQIAEPLAKSAEAQPAEGIAVGLDLGTTHTVVAVSKAEQGGQLSTDLQPIDGEVLMPSVVWIEAGDEGKVWAGASALHESEGGSGRLIRSIKRALGRETHDWPAALRSLADSSDSDRPALSPEAISGRIAAHALKVVDQQVPRQQWRALVVTVPAYFDEVQRRATHRALQIAGFDPTRLIAEPTAAAIERGLGQDSDDGIYLIYDFGGGTFDCSIVQGGGTRFQVLASAGDTALGGDDLDAALADMAMQRWGLPKDESVRAQLKAQARSVREDMSGTEQVAWVWRDHELTLTQDLLAGLFKPVLDRTLALCRRAMRDADLQVEDLQGCVLIGGVTRTPKVRQALTEFLARSPLSSTDPDTAVALGAARLAASLGGLMKEQMTLVDVTPLTLGIETLGGLMEPVIPRNTPIPARMVREFTTGRDNQTGLRVRIVQGERDLVADCRNLGSFSLRGLPSAVAGALRIEVCFEMDENGLLSVSARELSSGQDARIDVSPRLSEQQVTSMLTEASRSAEQDMRARARIESCVEAEQLIWQLRSSLSEDGHLLTQEVCEHWLDKLAGLEELVEKVRQSQPEDPPALLQQLRDLSEEIANLSADFAQQRMDESLKKGLVGHKLSALEDTLDKSDIADELKKEES